MNRGFTPNPKCGKREEQTTNPYCVTLHLKGRLKTKNMSLKIFV